MAPVEKLPTGHITTRKVFQGAIFFLPPSIDRAHLKRLEDGQLKPLAADDEPSGHPVLILSRSKEQNEINSVHFVVMSTCNRRKPQYGLNPALAHRQHAPIEDYIAIEPSSSVDCKHCTIPHPVLRYRHTRHIPYNKEHSYVCIGTIYSLRNWRRLNRWWSGIDHGSALDSTSVRTVLNLAQVRQRYTPHEHQFDIPQYLPRVPAVPTQNSKVLSCVVKHDGLDLSEDEVRQYNIPAASASRSNSSSSIQLPVGDKTKPKTKCSDVGQIVEVSQSTALPGAPDPGQIPAMPCPVDWSAHTFPGTQSDMLPGMEQFHAGISTRDLQYLHTLSGASVASPLQAGFHGYFPPPSLGSQSARISNHAASMFGPDGTPYEAATQNVFYGHSGGYPEAATFYQLMPVPNEAVPIAAPSAWAFDPMAASYEPACNSNREFYYHSDAAMSLDETDAQIYWPRDSY